MSILGSMCSIENILGEAGHVLILIMNETITPKRIGDGINEKLGVASTCDMGFFWNEMR